MVKRIMKTFTLDQARTAASSGGVLSANLRPVGSMFVLEFETRNAGAVLLIASGTKKVRRFGNPVKAFEIVRILGLEGGRFSVAQWRPDEVEIDRVKRPDRALNMKKTHEAVDLKRVLDERISKADKSDTAWLDHDDVFADLEKRYAA
jgi:hypothetical protein